MRRVVIIGNGMVGSRCAADLVAAAQDVSVTVLGDEPVPAYNRVLLSSVVAGAKDPRLLSIAPAPHDRLEVLSGVAASSINRELRLVWDSRHVAHRYDELIIATGSRARVPAIAGVSTVDGLLPGVFVLKDLADAEAIVARADTARSAVVLGAGVLGIEVATGLAQRGLDVRMVHLAGRVMDRQLGAEAADVAQHSLRRLGVEPQVRAGIARVIAASDQLHAVLLEDGSYVLADLLVLCCGTIPDVALAKDAGIGVDRGIVVDAQLRTSDPHVYAIGDCAQPPDGARGLVAQGWDQASRLVEHLTGTSRGSAKGSTDDVVRVKAPGMALVTMGLCGDFDRTDPRLRILSLTDRAAGRYIELVIEGDLLAGGTCIGDADIAAAVSALYTRRQPVPQDPAHLMIGAISGEPSPVTKSPAELDDADLVCNCNTVPAGAIRAAIGEGCATVADIAAATRATTGCGDCRLLVSGLIACTNQPAAVAS